MVKNHRITIAVLFSLLFATTILLIVPSDSVWAEGSDKKPVDKKELYLEMTQSGDGTEDAAEDEDEEGLHVHADPTTFEKNFCLSVDQKEYTIKQIETVVSTQIDPKMSDLQKYYTLAKWANQRVIYDNDFWSVAYNFDYYSHQWDAYGAINEDELSVCAGIAIFYSNLCHAADLACKCVRLDPTGLDHTITYIPDINGHAYYADITENDFLMSKNACSFAPDVDLAFAQIENIPDDGSFEYRDEELLLPSDIKECWQDKKTYKKWFREYALHKDTDKKFANDYVENGSGKTSDQDGYRHAAYTHFADYPAQTYASRDYESGAGQVTGIWFLDDFYVNPTAAKAAILGKKLDKQFLDISGVEANYDCNTAGELEDAVNARISIRYFPSADENSKIVAEAAELTLGEDGDYTVACTDFDWENGKAEITIRGTGQDAGGCTGEYTIPVSLYSATVKTAPTRINGLVYNGSQQDLVEPGEGQNGTMVYAMCEKDEQPPDDAAYTETLPAATNVGSYDVWYKVIGNEVGGDDGYRYRDTKPEKFERAVRITAHDIDDEDVRVKLSKKTFTYNGKVQKPSIKITSVNGMTLKEGRDYTATWVNKKSKNADTYSVEFDGIGNYNGLAFADYTIKKAANPMKLKGKTVKVKRSKLRKKSRTIKRAKAITVSKAQGKTSYKLVSAKKGKKNFKKKFKINAKTGNITVKKGLKKGKYKVKVQVKAAGNRNYKASARKKVTFTVRVK